MHIRSISRAAFVRAAAATPLIAGLSGTRVFSAANAAAVRRIPAGGPDAVPVTLTVNGAARTLSIEPRVTLLDALRDRIGLTGTKKGCDQGTCGACTVLLDGKRVNACLTLAIMTQGKQITTVEGLADGTALHPVQAAFIEHDAFQCGYCTPGQIMSAVGLLNEKRSLDRESVREWMSGNICRCGAYPHIVDAVQAAGGHRA